MEHTNQFKGLPMESFIVGPLQAACTANAFMAQATADFIREVGFTRTTDGKAHAPRMVDFSFERPGMDEEGQAVIDLINIQVPMLAIVPIPALQVHDVHVVFDMEVKNTISHQTKGKESTSLDGQSGLGAAFFKSNVQISGAVATTRENTRATDQSAKYHIEVNARNMGVPEGLARVLDMMNQAAVPRSTTRFKPDARGAIPRRDNGAIDESKGTLLNPQQAAG